MKLIMQTIPVATKCKLCEKLDTKLRRRAAEADKRSRWEKEGSKFKASISKSTEIIEALDKQIEGLKSERIRRRDGIGALTAHA